MTVYTNNLHVPLIDGNAGSRVLQANASLAGLDAALTELFTLTISGADQTLTATQFGAGFCFRSTGTIAASRSLIVPAKRRSFLVDHRATGGTLTVKVATGANVVLNSGECRLLYCDGTDVQALGASAQQNYDVSGQYDGKPGTGVVIFRYPVVRAFTLPASMTGSRMIAGTAGTTISSSLAVKKNAVTTVGTATFATSATVATWAGTGGSFAAGDVLTVVAPSPQNTTLQDLAWSLAATLG